MNLKKYQNTIRNKQNLNKINASQNLSQTHYQNENKIKSNKLNVSQPISNFKSMNNSISNKNKKEKKIHVNLYTKPINNNIRFNYFKNQNKTKNKDFSLMNLSKDLYNSIDIGRKAINNFINIKKEKIIKAKEKTPFKKRINIEDNKENILTNITNKTKNIYKTKTSNNFKTYKINTNYNFNTTKENINNITLRLFKKETISSKNKLKKSILYTPNKKQNLNSRNHYSKSRARTCQQSAKKRIKYLLTSQKSESRFYSNENLSFEENKNEIKNKKKKDSFKTQIEYSFNNIKNINKIIDVSLINKIKNAELKNKVNTKTNMESNPSNNSKNEIHNFLYHTINSPLSSEIIFSESKGIISTKCPLGHITNYKFKEYYSKFRAIPDIDTPFICFICKNLNNIASSFYCEKCYNCICHNCIFKHEKNLSHRIISIQNMNTFCILHNKKYNSFCYDCNKNCCELCHFSNDKKNHKYTTFEDILSHFKTKEKSVLFIQSEIRNQLRTLNDFIERYNEDLKRSEHYEILKGYFEEYINYFRNILKLKEKFISKYNYNQNNYYNLMNVLNLSLPLFYDYNKESLFKLSRTNDIYDKYLIINDFINFINNNSINIFEGNQDYKKYKTNIKNTKILRTIKPCKILNLVTDNIRNDINENKYPKQILDLEYNGYFLLLKDNNFDIYDRDLNLIKNYNFTNIFGNSYNEMIIGTKILDNKNMAIFNSKQLLIIKFSYDFSTFELINEFDLKINGICNGFNNFGFDDETYEIQNPLFNNILDINKDELISFGIRYEEKYIGTIWQKNKTQESQIIDINSKYKNSIYNIISVLKYNENKFAILEKNSGAYYNVKIYKYESPYNNEANISQSTSIEIIGNTNDSITMNDKLETINGSIKQKMNNNDSKDYNNDKVKNKTINGINYEKDENSEEDEDEILKEIKMNAKKREEELIQIEKLGKFQQIIKKSKEEIIIIKSKIFNELFNLENINYKTYNDSIPSSSLLTLIKINDKTFGFLDYENIILVDFEKCSVISKINYRPNTLIYIDKTPNDNLLFREKNKIISYHIKNNDLIRINLPVFEYNAKDKKTSKWYLISGSEEFINKAKIIDDNFMICLFEFRMEKWNINQNLN